MVKAAAAGTGQAQIEHVVVLMLENRSFDHMLGFLAPNDTRYEQLDPDAHYNLVDPKDPTSHKIGVSADGIPALPVDPDHSHEGALQQLGYFPGSPGPNSGFVANYRRKAGREVVSAGERAGVDVGSIVMRCLTPEKVPALSTLAREFALCTRWFSSVPGATWPNRNFLHAATSDQAVDIEFGVYRDRTIFELLEDELEGSSVPPWRVYHDGPSQLMAFRNLWSRSRLKNWRPLPQFEHDCRAGSLAWYTFIEPDEHTPVAMWFDGVSHSQHPGNNLIPVTEYAAPPPNPGADFRRGDELIAWVYKHLSANEELFQKTVLVITYDEHGGLYDHVTPGVTTPPGDPLDRGFLRTAINWALRRGNHSFDFASHGVRVPAVVVSPWIDPNTVDPTVYDHASVPRTLRDLFARAAQPLTQRDANANSFAHLVSHRQSPRRADELPVLDAPTPEVGRAAAEAARASGRAVPKQTLNDFDRGLLALGLVVADHLDRPVDDPITETAEHYLSFGQTEAAGGPTVVERVRDAMERFTLEGGNTPSSMVAPRPQPTGRRPGGFPPDLPPHAPVSSDDRIRPVPVPIDRVVERGSRGRAGTDDDNELGGIESGGSGERSFSAPDTSRPRDIAEASFGPPPPQAEVVIGQDDRKRVANTRRSPWRMTASLEITGPDNKLYLGTGWFIGPKTLVTAGHCVYVHNGPDGIHEWVRAIRVMPGRNGRDLPFQAVVSRSFRTVAGWARDADANYDYGAIVLPTPAGEEVGWVGLAVLGDDELRGMMATVSGYPDKTGDEDGTQWYDRNRVKDVDEFRLYYDADTQGGQSGAAVYALGKDDETLAIGIHAYGSDYFGNSATRITNEVHENLRLWRA